MRSLWKVYLFESRASKREGYKMTDFYNDTPFSEYTIPVVAFQPVEVSCRRMVLRNYSRSFSSSAASRPVKSWRKLCITYILKHLYTHCDGMWLNSRSIYKHLDSYNSIYGHVQYKGNQTRISGSTELTQKDTRRN